MKTNVQCLRNVAMQLHSYFGSTYLCEIAISYIKVIKSKYQATLSDDQCEQCLHLVDNDYYPTYNQLCNAMQRFHVNNKYK